MNVSELKLAALDSKRAPVRKTLIEKALELHEVTHILYIEKGFSYSQIIAWYKSKGVGNFNKYHIKKSLNHHDKLTKNPPAE